MPQRFSLCPWVVTLLVAAPVSFAAGNSAALCVPVALVCAAPDPAAAPQEEEAAEKQEPLLQRIVGVVWDGEEFEPRFEGRLRLEERHLGFIPWGRNENLPPDPGEEQGLSFHGRCTGLAFHPDGRIAFSEGHGSNSERRLVFWSKTRQTEPVVELGHNRTAGSDKARSERERQGIIGFFAGPLTFDELGTCYFSLGPCMPNGIYRVVSARPVDIQKLCRLPPNVALQVPLFDRRYIYSTSRRGIYRYPLRGADVEKPPQWFLIKGDEIRLRYSLVISKTKVVAEVALKPRSGEPRADHQYKTLLFDKESKAVSVLSDRPLGPMAISWNGKRMIRFDSRSKSIREFSFN